MRPTRFHATVILASLINAVASAPAQVGGGMDLSWSTIDGGGTSASTGGAFALAGTVGQPDAPVASVMAGGTYSLAGGFWQVVNVCHCPGDLNGDGKKDGRDVQLFVGCLLVIGNCPCADVDQANGVNSGDAAAFVSNLLGGQPCS